VPCATVEVICWLASTLVNLPLAALLAPICVPSMLPPSMLTLLPRSTVPLA